MDLLFEDGRKMKGILCSNAGWESLTALVTANFMGTSFVVKFNNTKLCKIKHAHSFRKEEWRLESLVEVKEEDIQLFILLTSLLSYLKDKEATTAATVATTT